MNAKLKVICIGIKVKLDRGENLEEIFATYTKLTSEEKEIVREIISLEVI